MQRQAFWQRWECTCGFSLLMHTSVLGLACPGNRRSAGKDKGGGTNKGNRWLRGMLTECAWAAAGKKDCYLKASSGGSLRMGRRKPSLQWLTTCSDWSITSSAKDVGTKKRANPFWMSDSGKS